jgi:hypothetical protein
MLPLILQCQPQVFSISWQNTPSTDLTVKVLPQILNNIQIWTVSWPWEDSNVMVGKPGLRVV